MGQWLRMAPCPKAGSFCEFVLSPATPTLNAIGFNFSCDTSSHLDNLSSHAVLLRLSVGTASFYMGFSGEEGVTSHVRSPVLARPREGMFGAWKGQDPAAQ